MTIAIDHPVSFLEVEMDGINSSEIARAPKTKPQRRRGAPLKLTYQLITTIGQSLRRGRSKAGTARDIGVDERTLRYWNRRGREEASGLYHDLRCAVDAALEEWDRKRKAPPAPRKILKATIRRSQGGNFSRVDHPLTVEKLQELCQLCDSPALSRGFDMGTRKQTVFWVRQPRRDAQLSRAQQEMIENYLQVTLQKGGGEIERLEFKPAAPSNT